MTMPALSGILTSDLLLLIYLWHSHHSEVDQWGDFMPWLKLIHDSCETFVFHNKCHTCSVSSWPNAFTHSAYQPSSIISALSREAKILPFLQFQRCRRFFKFSHLQNPWLQINVFSMPYSHVHTTALYLLLVALHRDLDSYYLGKCCRLPFNQVMVLIGWLWGSFCIDRISSGNCNFLLILVVRLHWAGISGVWFCKLLKTGPRVDTFDINASTFMVFIAHG